MCGIAGTYAWHPAAAPVAEAELERFEEALRARGPDGRGRHLEPCRRVGLVHTRLAVQGRGPAGHQPVVHDDAAGGFRLLWNGELYDQAAWRALLETLGLGPVPPGDTAVLAALWRRFGEAVLPRLRGMFALAVYEPARARLVLARDTFGLKPLYFGDDGWTFRFASTVGALAASGCVDTSADPAATLGFLVTGSVPEPFTTLRGVRALQPGHAMVVDADGPRRPRPFLELAELFHAACPLPEEDFRDALDASVALHLEADDPVAFFLSGGVDSRAILAAARRSGRPLGPAFTLVANGEEGLPDERAAARAAAREAGVPLHEIRVDHRTLAEAAPEFLAAMDQPSIDGFNVWLLARAMRREGHRAALTGVGGDEWLGGYPSFRDVPRLRRAAGVLALLPGSGPLLRGLARGLAPRVPDKLAGLGGLGRSLGAAWLLRRAVFLPAEARALLGEDLYREGLFRWDPVRRLEEELEGLPGPAALKVAYLEARLYLRNQLLRDADGFGMAHGVELRAPLVDLPFVRRALGVLLAEGPERAKAALARAAFGAEAGFRIADKTGFALPLAGWLAGGDFRWRERPELVGAAVPFARRWAYEILRGGFAA